VAEVDENIEGVIATIADALGTFRFASPSNTATPRIRGNDYSSMAYWYQREPHEVVPELPAVSSRLPRRWPEHGLWDR
jgi:hypothetical protein